MLNYEIIGKKIKNLRIEKGMSQGTFAKELGVSVGYVSQVERGITKISLDLLGAISTILSRDMSYFVSESAVHSEKYLESELVLKISKLDDKKRKFALKMIKELEEL